MAALMAAMLLSSCAALVLGLVGWRRVGRVEVAAEAIMLAAMLDVHLPVLHLVQVPLWSAALGGAALVSAFHDRLRRGSTPGGGDALHAVGLVLAAALVLVSGSPADSVTTIGTHAHGTGLLVWLTLALGVHAACALGLLALRRPGRVEAIRRLSSLAAILAMGAMGAVG